MVLKQYTCPRKAGSAHAIRDWTEHAEGGSRNLYLGRFEDEGEKVVVEMIEVTREVAVRVLSGKIESEY